MVIFRAFMVKSANTERTQYSFDQIREVLDHLSWSYKFHPNYRAMIQFEKTFPTREDMVGGLKELIDYLRLIHHNISFRTESVTDGP